MAAPLFSIVTPVYEPPLDVLSTTIESVLAQEHEDWELILVDDCSPSQAVRDVLRSFAVADPRIRLIERETNGHIVAASNEAIQAATGEFVVLLDHDDLLTPDALAANARAIAAHPEVDYLYSDEDKIDAQGRSYDAFRKPDWSPERLRGQNYACHLSVMRRSVVDAVGGFREGFDGSQDHDLILRVTEQAREIVHLPEILYHWRVVPGSAAGDVDAKPYAWEAGRKAVQEHMDRLGLPAQVGFGRHPGMYTLQRQLDPSVKVSIIIPTIGKAGLVWGAHQVFVVEAVRSIVEHTQHPNYEIVVVYDLPTPQSALDELVEMAGAHLTLVPFTEPFNYSRKMNLGVLHSSGERLVLLNDDVLAINDGWIEALVAPLDEPDVGLTGAKLYFSNDFIQHAGHAYHGGHYHHPFSKKPRDSAGPFGALVINRETSGVTAACAGIRRDTYLEVGGLTETLPINFNDVDLSYKIRDFGLRIVWLADVELYHFESRSRKRVVDAWERQLVLDRWGPPEQDAYLPHHGAPRPPDGADEVPVEVVGATQDASGRIRNGA